MSTLYSNQFNSAYVADPISKLEPKEYQGMVRRIFADITLGAELAVNDIVKLCKLPANAAIIEARIVAPGGLSGTLQLGWSAGSAGLEAADNDGIIPNLSGSAAIDSSMAWSAPAFNKRFVESVDIELLASVATTGFSGDKIQFELRYIVD